jgi:hypothetical protein
MISVNGHVTHHVKLCKCKWFTFAWHMCIYLWNTFMQSCVYHHVRPCANVNYGVIPSLLQTIINSYLLYKSNSSVCQSVQVLKPKSQKSPKKKNHSLRSWSVVDGGEGLGGRGGDGRGRTGRGELDGCIIHRVQTSDIKKCNTFILLHLPWFLVYDKTLLSKHNPLGGKGWNRQITLTFQLQKTIYTCFVGIGGTLCLLSRCKLLSLFT